MKEPDTDTALEDSVMAFSGLIIIQKTQGLCGVKAG